MPKKTRYIVFILALAILAIAAYFIEDGLIYKSAVNYAQSLKADSELISIQIDENDFQKIEKHRQESIERGSIVNDGDNYVPAKIIYKEDTLKAEMRLKGHMLDHVKGEKWSYRVKVKKKGKLFGMRKFTLQHPGTRNYAYEWLYHQMMKKEGIIALRYDYVTVELNGKNLGVYALEEHFTQDLVDNNNRPSGAILRFNPTLYWQGRIIRDKEKLRFTEEFSGYNGSFPEAYDRKATFSDSVLRISYLTAQSILEQFKMKELKTSEVFDVEKLATFHAIIDLIGGHHSLDWSDVKYYHNSQTNKLEPIAYESFSAHPIKKISASHQFRLDEENTGLNFHANLFSDSVFFNAYISELKRVSEQNFLDEFLSSVDNELQKKLAIIYSEFPYKDFTPDVLYSNQRKIKAFLNEKKPFHVFLQDHSNDSIEIAVGSNSGLPYKLKAIRCGSESVRLNDTIVYAKAPKKVIDYKLFAFTSSKTLENKIKKGKNISLTIQLLGDNSIREIEIFDYPYQRAIDKKSDK